MNTFNNFSLPVIVLLKVTVFKKIDFKLCIILFSVYLLPNVNNHRTNSRFWRTSRVKFNIANILKEFITV